MGSSKMAWSKSTRIRVMIAIDTTFFLLELIVGFLAHSLALTADAFHMLNDIISLAIGLWAVVAAQKASTDEFTFGWVRAEILGAFFNAVFLIALCVSIILEAITRFVEPPVIDNPKLILIVGCAGLFSNLVGFVVLGGHGHSHGPGGHDQDHDHEGHGHDHDGHTHTHVHDEEEAVASRTAVSGLADESASPAGVFPEAVIQKVKEDAKQDDIENDEAARRIRFGDSHSARDETDTRTSRTSVQSKGRHIRRPSKNERSRLSMGDLSIHPASFRQDIIAASMAASSHTHEDSSGAEDDAYGTGEHDADEQSPLLNGHDEHNHGTLNSGSRHRSASGRGKFRPRRDSSVHAGHNHTLPKQPGEGGHSHSDMGMNAMVLHVIGDALGNIGVIVTALIIWLTDLPGKYYADPAVSLVITAIILKTAIPLTRATSKVLLQATPDHISIPAIREDIEALPGVVTCHHIHIWQLSDTKVVASMHLEVSFPLDSDSGATYMHLAKQARKCLHGFGIHSATIQPEFFLGHQRDHPSQLANRPAPRFTDDGWHEPSREVCLLECIDDCEAPGCCSSADDTSSSRATTPRPSGSSQN